MLARVKTFFSAKDAPERLPWRLFWTGFLVRVLYMTLAHTYRLRVADDHFQFGWEMGRIARALVTGYGYADPFVGHSGPTAWTPPFYPLLLAGVFKLTGVYTLKSAWLILTINSVFSAATAPAIYRIAMWMFSGVRAAAGRKQVEARSVALWSAWLWALYPAAMQYAVRWVWDMSITACLFAWMVWVAMRLREVAGCRWSVASEDAALEPPGPYGLSLRAAWLLFGLLWGLIALLNSALLAFLPACGMWIVWPAVRTGRGLVGAVRGAGLAAVVCLAVIAPWVVRNYRAFHAFVPMRSNFGAELYEAATVSNRGFPTMATLPLVERAPQFERYKEMGELAYTKRQGELAKERIRANPGGFFGNAATRVYFFWVSVPHPVDTLAERLTEAVRTVDYALLSFAGLMGLVLALRRSVPGAWLFFWAFLLVPLIYYFVTVQARFRHPMEPLLLIMAVYLFQSAERAPRAS